MSLSNYLEDELLDHLRGSAYTAPSGLYVKLHTGDPGEAGTNNAAGETDRIAVTFGAASSGSMSGTGSPVAEWTNVSTTETITHFSIWDNSTAGNCLGSGALSGSVSVTAGDTLQLTALTWALD
jgi:hypothetical protein